MTEACEVGLLPLAHQLEVKRLLAEVTLCRGVRPQLQTRLLPRLHQPVCGDEAESEQLRIRPFFPLIMDIRHNNSNKASVAAGLKELQCIFLINEISHIIYNGHTNKVVHHLGSVVWCGGDAEQLLSFSHSGVVDCLNIDVVTGHHDVTDLSVLLCICHLPNRCIMCQIHILKCLKFNSDATQVVRETVL